MMGTALAVALGGMLGCLLRFAVGQWATSHFPQHFYSATLVVNVLGCLLIGVLYGAFLLRPDVSPVLRVGLITGFLGGLTTFSSFSLDTLRLLDSGQATLAFGYVGASVLGGLLATWLALTLTKL